MQHVRTFFQLLRQTFSEFSSDNAPRLAAALAYYTAFSIAPLLVVVIAVIGLVFSEDTARQEIIMQIQSTAGSSAAEMVNNLIDAAQRPNEGLISTVIGVVTLLLGAIGAFRQLQGALDTIWDVKPEDRKGGVVAFLKDNILSFGMILVIGFLLLVSLVLSTVLSVVDGYLRNAMPGADILLTILNQVLSLGVTVVLFAMIYKFLPHVKIEWRDVWIGALVTAILFSIGRFLLALYLGNSSTVSPYGAAGAFVLVLFWIYYSAQIVLLGAEFTQVFARRYGSFKERASAPEDREGLVLESEPIPVSVYATLSANRAAEQRSRLFAILTGFVTLFTGVAAGWLGARSSLVEDD